MKYYKLYTILSESKDEDKLKETIRQLFEDPDQFNGDQSFSEYINEYKKQPSPVATKHVATSELLKKYEVKCCKGTHDGYDYFFPIVEIDDQKYVIDLADNTDGPIMAKVETIDNSLYKIIKVMETSEFINKYNQITKGYDK